MTLNDSIRELVITGLEGVKLSTLNTFAKEYGAMIYSLYQEKVISDRDIDTALEKVIYEQAAKDYGRMTNEKRTHPLHADHVERTDCLAYALEKEAFSVEEVQQIPFDHGQNQITFVARYRNENLLRELREKLFQQEEELTNK
ncbi:hypothetical protein HN695_07375 [Candidatus Woesearchaeota archaeon]|jgi:hypothetical protein|nr:hypothetical protein [Candidatus Woesearchaeota archaeon]MBT5271960.1 hypothetical protein [Candidatus Woesearchaeota archaeon]MBT6040725.1 hypothetical protein [Candidatus Woesearchaeota archaeon]MBT6337446.1 hypothetical protein [Candidatus Woesearchaeota archaeon]MBT7928128.1 hypothetical protein [Candidatus Woesearchaeota archaeon]